MDGLLPYAIGALLVWLVVKLTRTGKRESYLPNAPPTVPLLGNLNVFPKLEAHFKYVSYSRLHHRTWNANDFEGLLSGLGLMVDFTRYVTFV